MAGYERRLLIARGELASVLHVRRPGTSETLCGLPRPAIKRPSGQEFFLPVCEHCERAGGAFRRRAQADRERRYAAA